MPLKCIQKIYKHLKHALLVTIFNSYRMRLFPGTLFLVFFTLHLHAQFNMQQMGYLPYSQDLNDIWGYVDETGIEYALVGVYNGFSVVSLADPANPEQVFFGTGPGSIWRDIKTWGDYAYVSNETGNGVYIVDLSPLPDGPITSTAYFTGSSFPFSTAHNLWIDEFGKLYIFGSNSGNGGAIICDLTQDPMNPVELGRFNTYYLHDGMSRGDTLWGAAIYQGLLLAIDVSNPANTSIKGTVSTPSQFTHNTWLSDDGTHVFTTDEVNNGFIGSYNVTDLSNMFEADRIRVSYGNNVIPHNVHVLNDFLITSYYTSGVTIHDAKFPDRLFEVGHYDTSPAYGGGTFNGAWGAYPYLPSGLILVSDIEEGLFVLNADYQRAAYLEGVVSDFSTDIPIFNANVQVLGTDLNAQTSFTGAYSFGTLLTGTYDVRISALGYVADTLQGVEIVQGEITELNHILRDFYVGMDETISFPAEVSPNPFDSEVNIVLKNQPNEQSYLRIFNSIGKEVLKLRLEGKQNTINIPDTFASGLYLLVLEEDAQYEGSMRLLKR